MEQKQFCKKNGRPAAFSSPEELEQHIDKYFEGLNVNRRGSYIEMPTKEGLTFHLGVTKETLWRYSDKDGFSYPISKAYLWIEEAWLQCLWKRNCRGAIFYLTRAFGYRHH